MIRSIRKGPYIHKSLLKKLSNLKSKQDIINTWSRSSVILPDMLGITFGVYNGKKHLPVFITENMIGHKLGEFSITRTFKNHKSLDKKIKRKN